MKKLVLLVFVTLFAAGASIAQPGDPAARLQREIEGLTTELGLSKDQVEKVTPIVKESQEKRRGVFQKMRDSGSFDREKMRDEMNKLQADTDKKLKAVLTPEQGEKLDAYRKKQAEERAKRMQERGQ